MAISTNISYPAEYLPCPKKEGFGLQAVSPLKSTPMTTGRRRQRRAYTSVPTQTKVIWIFNDSQAQLFEAWFRDKITDGADWFNMPLLTPLGEEDYVCRFVDIYEGPTPEGGMYWRYSAELELWERPILPPGWADFPDYIINSNIIDLAVNREWPEE
ncbi:hypothetical protein KUF61_13070 [Klebsiella aerogenes]|uniref:hypothetical protein n=1 Tax=Klebsiella aerogenes TaxID=548 RepID=UPI001BD0F248|nr:hypothetical protein [Klebsiella aerogenes]MBV2177321.1 hypothetical protein [Klebsiella aerogenes]HBR1869646.1 hypothetical protein [Klebsiella pneumoniae]